MYLPNFSKANSSLVTHDKTHLLPSKKSMILISIDVSMKIHQFVCIKWSFFIEAGLDGSGKNKKS